MATLGSIYHDFPRLAKQSGFYFQLHRGRVNWTEIENLSVDEIIEKRDYHLLERNLMNVINCNLEREYDLKILDQNFVKLFKLAQLGIDYLSYCQMYLDRCVVLLQEQLTNFQEANESLKQDNQKRKEELNKNKRKSKEKGKNYQCEKCEKVFISDVYLKFHDKRRHNNPGTPNSLDILQKKFSDISQQTEDGRKLSVSTQTLFPDETTADLQECEDSVKNEHSIKMEKLEQELKDFKERLKKAESSLTEKAEKNSQLNQSNAHHSLNVTGSMCCNSMLMLLPSYLKLQGSSYFEIKPECQTPGPEVCQMSPSVNLEAAEIKPPLENKTQSNSELEKSSEEEYGLPKRKNNSTTDNTEIFQEYYSEERENTDDYDKENINPKLHNEIFQQYYHEEKENTDYNKENINPKLHNEIFQQYYHEEKENTDYNKENINPKLQKNSLMNSTKPLPPPRKLKKGLPPRSSVTSKTMVETPTARTDIHKEEEMDCFSSRSIVHRSTPVKEKPREEDNWEVFETSKVNLSEIKKPTSSSNESLNNRNSLHSESKAIIKKIAARNSPKLKRFSQNLKRSLTNLYESVSSTEKDAKKKESDEQNLRAVVVNGLNDRLRELGVDPEWQGIPKKTMKQKLNILKHRRSLLSKQNPMFPVIRQNIEEKILQKIKNNLGRKKANLINKLTKQGSMTVEDPPAQDISPKIKPEFVRVKKSAMYDTDTETDSDSTASDSEGNFSHVPDEKTSQKCVVLEELTSSSEEEKEMIPTKTRQFDISVFQVGRGNANNVAQSLPQNDGPQIKRVGLFTDSDTEDNIAEYSGKVFESLKSSLNNTSGVEGSESAKIVFDNAEPEFEVSKTESHGILKDDGLRSRLPTSTKKRVLFANCSDGFEEELSDSPIDDDLWPFKSDSEKDMG